MRRKDRDIIDNALWVAYERGREGSGLGAGHPSDVVKALEVAGFEIVRKVPAGRPHIVERTTVSGGATIRSIELVPGQADAAATPITRDLVLFDCEDYEGNEAAATALGLDSYPGNDPVTLGWLIDEHGEFRRTLSQLIYDITNGSVSKPNTDMEFVHECAGQAFVMNLLEEHPKRAEDPLFRPVMEQHFDAREVSAAVEIAQLRLDGNRVVRCGTMGTFNLGKPTASA